MRRPVDDVVDDAAGAGAIGLVAGHVRHGQERLDGVHVGVDAAVRVQLGELGVPGVHGQTVLLVPEVRVVGVERFGEQFLGARASDQRGRGGGQDDEGVRVADLARLGGAVRGDGRVPAAVRIVMQRPAQSVERLVDELLGVWLAVDGAERVDVRHAAGDPGLDAVGGVGVAAVVQPGGAAVRGGEAVSEMQQFVAFGLKQVVVLRRAEDIGCGCIGSGHMRCPSRRPSTSTVTALIR